MDAVDPTAFPMPRPCPFAFPAQYAELRRGQPVSKVILPSGVPAWLITSYELVRRILIDPRVSASRQSPNFPLRNLSAVPAASAVTPPPVVRSFIGLDPPEHTAHRRMLAPEFTPRRINRLRPRIRSIADERLDLMAAAGPPVDLVTELCLPVPSLVICELLGVPYADHEFFRDRTSLVVHRDTTPDDQRIALAELTAYFDELVTDKKRRPGDDLIGRLLRRYRASGRTAEEIHAQVVGVAQNLIVAGQESTSSMIALGAVVLLEHPGQLGELLAAPASPSHWVDELLRYVSSVEVATSRTALTDIELGGAQIRAGDGLIALVSSANRDEAAFRDPDAFDIRRPRRRHVAFGHGPHQCVGQHLARAQLEIALTALFRRFPAVRLTMAVDELPFKDDAKVYGIHRLPVTW